MKKLGTLAILTTMIFFAAVTVAFCQADPIISTTQNTVIHVNSVQNEFGITVKGGQTSTTTTTTVSQKEDGTTSTSVSINVQTVTQTYDGGGLKTSKVEGTVYTNVDPNSLEPITEGTDGSWSITTYTNTYNYESGRLASVTGSSYTYGDRGKDRDGTALGTFKQWGTSTYDVENGQARLLQSVSKSDYFSDANYTNKTGDSTVTTTYSNWQMVAGDWVALNEKEVSVQHNDFRGSETKITVNTVNTYGSNGLLTSKTETADIGANATYQKIVDANGGTKISYMQNYVADWGGWSATMGRYKRSTDYDWVMSL